jgi:hypothetical protein
MNIPYTLETIHVYQDELLREAEEQRLVMEALTERESASPLAWVGRRMIALGSSLVEISGEKTEGDAPRTPFSAN